MQILELDCDPWREQHFAYTSCPGDVNIPTNDFDAFSGNPRHQWVYDRLRLAQSQAIECGVAEDRPLRYPVFCKPVTNLRSNGASPGASVLASDADRCERCGPTDFWMRLLTGDHISTDVAVVSGTVCWTRHALGVPNASGIFDYWTIEAGRRSALAEYCSQWIGANLTDYTGMVNIETIGGSIIDVHLRFADQWPDLYGRDWLDALHRLYQQGRWGWKEPGRSDAYSAVLFGPRGRLYTVPHPNIVANCLSTAGISSIQFGSLQDDRTIIGPGVPTQIIRLAVINGFDLDSCKRVRSTIAGGFDLPESAPSLA